MKYTKAFLTTDGHGWTRIFEQQSNEVTKVYTRIFTNQFRIKAAVNPLPLHSNATRQRLKPNVGIAIDLAATPDASRELKRHGGREDHRVNVDHDFGRASSNRRETQTLQPANEPGRRAEVRPPKALQRPT
jgi:hypothetical protein